MFLRKLIGFFSRLIFIQYGHCKRCGRTWNIVKEFHDTPYTESSGCFALCQKCWEELTIEERIPFYEEMFDNWIKQGSKDWKVWLLIEKSVREGK